MHSLTPGPFHGSMPSPDLGGARLARQLDLLCSFMAIMAAASIWIGARLSGPVADVPTLVIASGVVLLVTACTGLWVMKIAAGRERLGIMLILDAVARKLFMQGSGRAVRLARSDTPSGGIAGLIEALVYRVLRLRATARSPGEPGYEYEIALRDGRAEARDIVSSLYQDAETLAETGHEIATAEQLLANESRAADAACDSTQASLSQVIDRVTSLTEAVIATTGQVRNVTASAVALSDRAFAGHRGVAALDDQTAPLTMAAEQIGEALKRMGNLAQSAAVEASRSGEGGKAFALIAAGIQDLASHTRALVGGMQADLTGMSNQAAEASRLAQDIGGLVKKHHELGLALSYAVCQQGEEIAAILQDLNETRSGFQTLRASVDAVTRHGVARLGKVGTLREAAARLPSHADAMARVLRDLPDFAPSPGFDF